VREYDQRGRVDAPLAMANADTIHLDRLLLVWHLALWLHVLGRHVIKIGARTQFDGTDRCDLSVVQLAWQWLLPCLACGRSPPHLFGHTPSG
jgi:hypothetical protein